MNPPIFKLCQTDPAIVAFFGGSPLRVYGADFAGNKPVRPYATWRGWGVPKNSLSDRPDSDYWQAQIDVFADDPDVAEAGILLVRDLVERHGEVTALHGLGFDDATKLAYASFDCWLSVPR